MENEKTPYNKYFKDYFNKYLSLQARASPRTFRSYKTGAKHLVRYLSEVKKTSCVNICFEDVGYDILLDFRNSMFDQGYSPRSCNLYLSGNRAYINYAASKDIMLQSLAYEVNKVPFLKIPDKKEPFIDNTEALTMLLDSPPLTYKGLRDRNILSCLYDGALRGDELTSILYGDIIWDHDICVVIHGKGRKERNIWFSPELKELLTQYRTLYHKNIDPLCPFFYTEIDGKKKRMSVRNLENLVEKYAAITRKRLFELYGDKSCKMLPSKITPHCLRRTRATGLLRDGVPLEEISVFLGHASVETTRKYYAFLSEEQKIALAKKHSKAIPTIQKKNDNIQDRLWTEGDELDIMFDF